MSSTAIASTSRLVEVDDQQHLDSQVATNGTHTKGKGKAKQTGNEWWKSLTRGESQYVVAPMVDQSELAWRILSRMHGATLCYTPMFHAFLFSSPLHPQYTNDMFDTSPTSLEGVAPYDRPLVVQFCANDKDILLKAAMMVTERCDAVDINLGCPQGIAKKGRYGAFLMDEWETISNMVTHLAEKLPIPVLAKTRIFPSLDRTLSYITHIISAGSSLLTLHGRTREAKGRMAGLASWSTIKAVRDHLTQTGLDIPMLANGGVPSAEEIEPCLTETGTQGIMSAEGNLYNPMLFRPVNATGARHYFSQLPIELQSAILACDSELQGSWDPLHAAAYAPSTYLAAQYLAIVLNIPSTQTSTSAIKSHLFKLFRPVWAAGRHLEVREMLGRAGGGKNREWRIRVGDYVKVVDEMRKLLHADITSGALPPNSFRPLTHQEVLDNFDGKIPYSHAQPYFRVADPDAPKPDELETVVEKVEVVGVGNGEVVNGVQTEKEVVGAGGIESGMKRALSEEAEIESDVKKTKLASSPIAGDVVPVVPPTLKPCAIGSLKSPACGNTGAGRCAHESCSACCPSGMEGSTVASCEHHDEKRKREKERAEMKRQRARESKVARKEKKKSGSGGGNGNGNGEVPGGAEAVLAENLRQGSAASGAVSPSLQ